jgi:hypothetical protein
MSHSTEFTLRVHVPGAPSYPIGAEIWHVAITEVIAEEADTIANLTGAELLEAPTDDCRDALRARVIQEMTETLVAAGDTYTAPDGVRYSLVAGETDRRP